MSDLSNKSYLALVDIENEGMPRSKTDGFASTWHQFLTGPSGDVLAARFVARKLLASKTSALSDLGDAALATLVLTAVCLQAAALTGAETRNIDLLHYLQTLLGPSKSGPDLMLGSMQFVRYVAAEIEELGALPRHLLLATLSALFP